MSCIMMVRSLNIVHRTMRNGQRLQYSPRPNQRTFASSSSTLVPKIPLWIKGQTVSSTSQATVFKRHPQTGEKTCEIVIAGREETISAIRESKRAFREWRNVSGWERRKILTKVLSLLQERFPIFQKAIKLDTSFTDLVLAGDQQSAINLTDGAGAIAITVDGWIPPTTDSSLALVVREPYGPILSIPAFNYPLTLALRSIVYPIACGNTVIMKSSPLLPQVHHLLGPLFQDAGLPDGVFQILNFSEEDVADRVEQMIADDDIRVLGKILAAQCGRYLKPSIMELGGKSSAIVLPSADLKLAANNILFGAMYNSGQVCMSTERVIVHEVVAEEFEEVLRETAKVFEGKGGFTLERPGHSESLRELVENAQSEGARSLMSNTESSNSASYPPTILTEVSTSSKLYSEETFGPALFIQRVKDVQQAIEIANQHETGLSSSIWTNDYKEALNIAKKLECGAVHINAMTVHDQHVLPHGGYKSSGWGRFNGRGAIESFTHTKNITMQEPHLLPLHILP